MKAQNIMNKINIFLTNTIQYAVSRQTQSCDTKIKRTKQKICNIGHTEGGRFICPAKNILERNTFLRSDRCYQRNGKTPSLARGRFCLVLSFLLVVKQRRLIFLHFGCNKKNELLFPMLRKMNVQYVHVVSTCQGLLQHINPYLIYPLL